MQTRALAFLPATLAFLASVATPRAAAACDPVQIEQLEVKADAADTTAPGKPAFVRSQVYRIDPKDTDCGGSSISIHIAPPTDDRSPAEKVGVRIRHVAGVLPSVVIYDRPILSLPSDGTRNLLVRFRADDLAPVDFSVTLAAVDEAGNESEPTAPIRIQHGGGATETVTTPAEGGGTSSSGSAPAPAPSDDGSCTIGRRRAPPGGVAGLAALALMAALAGRRRAGTRRP